MDIPNTYHQWIRGFQNFGNPKTRRTLLNYRYSKSLPNIYIYHISYIISFYQHLNSYQYDSPWFTHNFQNLGHLDHPLLLVSSYTKALAVSTPWESAAGNWDLAAAPAAHVTARLRGWRTRTENWNITMFHEIYWDFLGYMTYIYI